MFSLFYLAFLIFSPYGVRAAALGETLERPLSGVAASVAPGGVSYAVDVENNLTLSEHNVSAWAGTVDVALSGVLLPDGQTLMAPYNRSLHFRGLAAGTPTSEPYNHTDTFTGQPVTCGTYDESTKVVLGTAAGHLLAIDAETQNVAWTWEAPLAPGTTDDPALYGTPACVNGVLYVQRRDALYLVDVEHGDTRTSWPHAAIASDAAAKHAAPAQSILDGNSVYVLSGDAALAKLSGPNGDALWTQTVPMASGSLSATRLVYGPVVSRYEATETVYVASARTVYVYDDAVDHAEAQCTYQAPQAIRSTPVVGKEGKRIYLALLNDIVALDDKCAVVWSAAGDHKYDVTPLALTLTGGEQLIFGAYGKIGGLDTTNGMSRWEHRSGRDYPHVTLAADGAVRATTTRGIVHTVGLSHARVLDMHTLAVALALSDDEAQRNVSRSLLRSVCDAAPRLRRLTPHALSIASAEGACDVLGFLDNGLDPFGHPHNYVNPLGFEEYKARLENVMKQLGDVEERRKDIVALIASTKALDKTALVAQGTVDAQARLAEEQLQLDNMMLGAYSTQLARNRDRSKSLSAAIAEDAAKTIREIAAEIDALRAQIAADRADISRQEKRIQHLKMQQLLGSIFGWILQAAAFVFSAGSSAIAAAIEIGIKVVQKCVTVATTAYNHLANCNTDCKIKQAQAQIAADKEEIAEDQTKIAGLQEEARTLPLLLSYAGALGDIDQAIKNPDNVDQFPSVLPKLSIDKIDAAKLDEYLRLSTSAMSADAAGDGKQVMIDLTELAESARLHVSLAKSWFQMALKRKNQEQTLRAAGTRTTLLNQQIARDDDRRAILAQALNRVAQQQCHLQAHAVQYAHDMRAQYRFWALKEASAQLPTQLLECSDLARGNLPPADASQAPSASGALDTYIGGVMADIEAEKNRRSNLPSSSYFTVRYALTRAQNPGTFARMEASGSLFVPVGLARENDTAPLATSYYDVRMYDVRAVLEGPAVRGRDTIALTLRHGGYSLIEDEAGAVHNFTHAARTENFMYRPHNNCPVQCACTYFDSRGGDRLDACPDFINYSPYGVWELGLGAAGLDLHGVEGVRLQFLVSGRKRDGPRGNTNRFFARDPTVQFPLPEGEWCPHYCGDPL